MKKAAKTELKTDTGAMETLEQCAGKAGSPGHDGCPIQSLLTRLGDKWSMLVLVAIARSKNNNLRFSELMRGITGISQRMLTTTLRHLERDGILDRHLYAEVPPRVEYSLTALGKGLLIPVHALVTWIHNEWPAIEKSRAEYDKRKGQL